ncbi:MAG: lytic transglycosylase domain-containing protein [Acidobacteriaceae bacterium]|nr:lytic transglycosylase domain-containing protein [Acidobacteriaceae bacterium]
MKRRTQLRSALLLSLIAIACPLAYGAEHITLRGGREFDCIRHEVAGDRFRLYLMPTERTSPVATAENENYIEITASSVLQIETIADPLPADRLPLKDAHPETASPTPTASPLTTAEMGQMLARAGARHNIDADLLASVVQAESNGNAHAVSRAGARGLMQLMPATAADLGVHNSFAPEENIGGGTAYLDALLTRYHDDITLAVAAYNAGPAAVDRYHGVPPYAETRAYVARVIREFNRRKRAAAQASHTTMRAQLQPTQASSPQSHSEMAR